VQNSKLKECVTASDQASEKKNQPLKVTHLRNVLPAWVFIEALTCAGDPLETRLGISVIWLIFLLQL
jgi:hypothetical protein